MKKKWFGISKSLHEFIKQKLKEDSLKILLYSPVPSPIDKIKNKYRWRIIIKCKFDNSIINLVNQTLEVFFNIKKSDSARIIADLNPNNMLW